MPNSPGIELRHLRYFLAVFEELHFGRAAERLHIAQPPLSQAIRKLEEELGVSLFERTSRAVKATPAGMALAVEARKVLDGFDFAVSEVRRLGRQDAPLRIGCVYFMPPARLQEFLSELRKRDGDLRTEVMHLWAREQVDRLRAGSLDLGVFVRSQDYAELECVPLYPGEQVNLFLPRGHPLAEKPVLTPEDVSSETLVSFPRNMNPVFFDQFMSRVTEAGYRFRGLHEVDAHDPRDALLAVAGGLGVAFGPASLPQVGEEGKSVTGRPLNPPLQFPETVVAWRENAPRSLDNRLAGIREAARALHESASAKG